jgi:VanZ family protein
MLSLRYRAFWIVTSLLLVAVVVWGSLQTRVPVPVAPGYDKIEHFSTYLFLAVWFTGLVDRDSYGFVVVDLLALGASMEVLQYLMHAGRTADIFDMAANTAGVGAGLVFGLLLTGGWAQKIEAWLK